MVKVKGCFSAVAAPIPPVSLARQPFLRSASSRAGGTNLRDARLRVRGRDGAGGAGVGGRERPYGDSPGVAQGRSYRPGLLFFRCAPSAFAEASADGRHAETLKVLKDWMARGEQKAR
jgi:hypothetical protein